VTGQIRAELLKIRSTRTTVGLVVGMVALVLLFVLLTSLLSHEVDLDSADDQRNLFGISSFASLFAALGGILVVTNEFRFGTIRPTFLVTPRRWQVLTAKLAASFLAGLVFAAIAEALDFGIGLLILSARGIPRELGGSGLTQLALGTLAAAGLWGVIGVGVGAVVRNQVGAVIGVLAWLFVVENLLFGLVPSVGRFTPGRAQDALTGMTTDHLLPAAAGGAVLIAWAAAAFAAGVAATESRDVN
jgi:ABC-2 type transport system permease protein